MASRVPDLSSKNRRGESARDVEAFRTTKKTAASTRAATIAPPTLAMTMTRPNGSCAGEEGGRRMVGGGGGSIGGGGSSGPGGSGGCGGEPGGPGGGQGGGGVCGGRGGAGGVSGGRGEGGGGGVSADAAKVLELQARCSRDTAEM